MDCQYPCHHFLSQDVLSTKNEPLAVCLSSNEIFIATSDPKIEVYSLRTPNIGMIQSLQSMSTIVSMSYCSRGQFIVTMEKNSRGEQFARAYINWREGTGGKIAQCATVAGNVSEFLPTVADTPSLLAIEIPTLGSPTSISCCQQTGNIALTYKFKQRNTVSIYRYVDIYFGRLRLGDFVRYIEIDFDFQLVNCALCENYLAVCSDYEAQIIKIKKHAVIDQQQQTVTGRSDLESSFTSEVSDLEWINFDKTKAKNLRVRSTTKGPKTNKVKGGGNSSFATEPAALRAYEMKTEHELEKMSSEGVEILGPNESVGTLSVVKPWLENCNIDESRKYSQEICVDRKYKKTDQPLISVNLIPTYLTEIGCSNNLPSFLTSDDHNDLAGMACLISSSSHSYMYQVMDRPRLLSTYTYFSPVEKIVVGSNLVHTISPSGLTTYTSRHYATALLNLKEFDEIEKVFPSTKLPTAAIGIQKFILGKIKDVCISEDYVVLICKGDDFVSEEDAWSIYALKNPPLKTLCSDLFEMAVDLKGEDLSNHFKLLNEAWFLCSWDNVFGKHTNKENLVALKKEICGRLGDYYSLPHRQHSQLAHLFYVMSDRPFEVIVNQHCGSLITDILPQQELKSCFGKGFLTYLDHMLFTDRKVLNHSETCGDQILQAYTRECPEKLSQLIVKSNLTHYNHKIAAKMIQNRVEQSSTMAESRKMPKPVDYVAIAYLQCIVGEFDSAAGHLSKISTDDMRKLCIEYLHLFFHNKMFTSLMQMICRRDPCLFVTLLVELHSSEVIKGYECNLLEYEVKAATALLIQIRENTAKKDSVNTASECEKDSVNLTEKDSVNLTDVTAVYRDLLSIMCKSTDIVTFLNLLPDDGNYAFYHEFINSYTTSTNVTTTSDVTT